MILKGNPQRLRWEHLPERTRKLTFPLPPSLQHEAEGCRRSGRGLPRGSINSFPANRFFRTGLWISLPTSFFKPDSCGADGGDSPAWENTDCVEDTQGLGYLAGRDDSHLASRWPFVSCWDAEGVIVYSVWGAAPSLPVPPLPSHSLDPFKSQFLED